MCEQKKLLNALREAAVKLQRSLKRKTTTKKPERGNREMLNVPDINLRPYCFSFRVKYLFPLPKIPKSSPCLNHFVSLSLIDHKA